MEEKLVVPMYQFMNFGIILDGDVYQVFGFSTLAKFRKMLKGTEEDCLELGYFRLNQFQKTYLKEKYGSVPYIKTSSETFAFYVIQGT